MARLPQRLLLLLLLVPASGAAPARPPAPAEYKAVIRYRIRAGLDERLAQFLRMVRHFEALGLQKDEGPDNEAEDPNLTLMSGTIASGNARKLLEDRHVRTLLLVPSTYALPDKAAPVKVRIELGNSLPFERQAQLARQVRDLLARELGYVDTIGYNSHGHTVLVGYLPADNLLMALEDLRWHTSGWLTPETPVEQQAYPLARNWPIRVIEVIPEPADAPAPAPLVPPTPPPQGQQYLLKVGPGLLALASQEEQKKQSLRFEVILRNTPELSDLSWVRELALAAPGLAIEGRLGPLVTVVASAEQVASIAALPVVSGVRLPPPASLSRIGASGKDVADPVEASGLKRLQDLGFSGKNVRVAVVDSDFRGWEGLVGRDLPPETKLVDLTAERHADLLPDPTPGDPKELGGGTRCAIALAQAAPKAKITLIRVDPAAPHMVQQIARYINGDEFRAISLYERGAELVDAARKMAQERDALQEERQSVLDNFGQDALTVKRRETYFKKQADFEERQVEIDRRRGRYLKLIQDLKELKGIRVVASSLVWNEGYPVDGGSTLSRYFDDQPFKAALWFQSVGDTQGQVWNGPFRDRDGNGAMEFAPHEEPLRPDRWTNELNFFGWQPTQGKATLDLPAKTTVRVSFQWREPHDPSFAFAANDPYRPPLAFIRLMVLRQRDPSGTKLGTDDLDVVALSPLLPQRLDNQATSGSYEQTVTFTTETAGRYALRVEGFVPETIRPLSEATLPAMRQVWELRPRIFVRTVAGPATGRVILSDYATNVGNPGMPADSRRILSVGAAQTDGRPQPYTASGPPMNMDLAIKPNMLAYDSVPGTDIATSFAAGLAATALSVGARECDLLQQMGVQPGGVLTIPQRWPGTMGR